MAALKQIGDIRIFAEIQRGATTTVYKGFQSSRDQFVLLKVLRPEFSQDEKLFKRFQDEAKIVSRIQHPNVVAIYEHGRSEGWSYFATEFVEGLNLNELIEQNKIPPDLAWFILFETAKGLQAAHHKNILHKDVKPANILISHTGDVKLADFGLADLRQSSIPETVEEIKGTLGYFSPEQILGESQEKYSDVFSLGATFYEMLSGTPAFFGKTPDAYFKAILNDEPLGYLQNDQQIPDRLIGICGKMLAKKPADRYQNCDDLLRDLKDFRKAQKLLVSSNELASYLRNPKSYSPKALNLDTEKVRIKRTINYRTYSAAFLALLILMGFGYFTLFSNKEKGQLQDVNSLKTDSLKTSLENNASFNASEILSDRQLQREPDPSEMDRDLIKPPGIEKESLERSEIITSENIISDSLKMYEANVGFLKLKCTPWAYVFIDADSIGMTPLRDSLELEVGQHQVVFKNPDFPEHETTVEIENDAVLSYQFSMWALVGKLNLEISPWAEVFIDGKYRDTIPPQERPLIILPGDHTLTLKHPDLGDFETTFEISVEENLNLRFNLRSLLLK
ncbi:serine/threonine protein kinase [candidate division KSB1 bacterium]|nr:serine/threonine protein kinase [candidate division KSB1 bacterium]